MKWIFGIFFLTLTALGMGVRVHPENFTKIIKAPDYENFYEVEFLSGRRVAGEMISQSESTITLKVGGGAAVFERKELAQIRALDANEVRSGAYHSLQLAERRDTRQVVTYRYEDSFFYALEKRLSRAFSKAAKSLRENQAAWNPFNLKTLGSSVQTAAPQEASLAAGPAAAAGLLQQLPSANGGEDYAALLKAGLEQLQKSK